MGWWSKTVMGGDEPLDALDHWNTILEIPHHWDSEDMQRFLKIPDIRDHVADRMVTHPHDFDPDNIGEIRGQVLAYILMGLGVPISEPLRQFLSDCAECDEWAADDEERAEYMRAFAEQIRNYDGTPQFPPIETLAGKIIEHAFNSEGEEQMVKEQAPPEEVVQEINSLLDNWIDEIHRGPHRND